MIVSEASDGTPCTAMVLTDPADPKSRKARCCRVPAVWLVSKGGKYSLTPNGAACLSHVNILLNELKDGS